MLKNIITTSTVFFSMLISLANSAQAGGNDWKAKMIADALTAAPPAVTNDATIYAWDKERSDDPSKARFRPLRLPCEWLPVHTVSANLPCPTRTLCALIKMPGILSSTSFRKRIR